MMQARRNLIPSILLSVAIISVMLMICFRSPCFAAGHDIADRDITSAVELELLMSEAVAAHLIDVTTNEGIVTLSGSVNTILARDQAIKIAESVKGVRSIIDKLSIMPVSRTDNQIRQDVESALLADPATDSYEIKTAVKNGTVTLTGTVESWAEKQLTAQVAKGVKGIKAVKNSVSIVYPKKRPDSEIKADIEGQLKFNPYIDDAMINVKVSGGKVILSGTVGSAAERTHVYNKAWVNGVSAVDMSALKVEWWARDTMRRKDKYVTRTETEIKDAVKDALLFDPRVASFNVDVFVSGCMVTLNGIVDNLKAKRAAEVDAKNTIGVCRVRNSLKVRPESPPADETIRNNIISALNRSPIIDPDDITVSVFNQKAYLYGTVATFYKKQQAEDIATRVFGVVDIANNILVRDIWSWKNDKNIREDVESELFWSPYVDSDAITVTVKDGEVTLTGDLDSWQQVNTAVDNAFQGGAESVCSRLKVNGEEAYYKVYYNNWYGLYSYDFFYPYGYYYLYPAIPK